MTDPEQPRDIAKRYNDDLAVQVKRWSRNRALLALLFLVVAILVWVASSQIFWALPLFILSAIFGVLWLDAHESLREIRARTWRRLGPLRNPNAKTEEGKIPR